MKITPIQLAKRVERWQHRLTTLGIAHFRIEAIHLVDQTPNGPGAAASVRTSQHYDTAEFWFTWDHLDNCDDQRLDETIIHEWLHVAWRDLDEALDAAEGWLPEKTYDDFEDRVNHEREGLIERLARLLYALHSET